ncbi:MAG: mannonate dehydratase, partial [Chloroflexota bacterium]
MELYLGVGSNFSEDQLRFAAQIGVDGIYGAPQPGKADRGFFDYHTLLNTRTRVEGFGLKYYSLRMLPWEWCYKWMLGLPGRDEQIENAQKSIRNMGAAGIPILTYNIHTMRFYRTSNDTPG